MKLDLTILPHTVYLLCGPTMCGKSTFAWELHDLVKAMGLRAAVVSSDQAREHYLSLSQFRRDDEEERGDDRHSTGMLAVSRQAFESLFIEYKNLVSYPVNCEVIVVDTTGFNEGFRKDICKVAKENNYRVELVTFEYKTREEYLPHDDYSTEDEKVLSQRKERDKIILQSLDTYRKRILPNLPARDYDARIRVKTRTSLRDNFDRLVKLDEVDFPNLDYLNCHVETDKFAVIGDSHECVEELSKLITQLEETHPGIAIIYIGDFLDKGGNTTAMVNYMYKRVVEGTDLLLQGNHENYSDKRFSGQITEIDKEMEAKNFSAVAVFDKEPETLATFKKIYAKASPFLIVSSVKNKSAKPVVLTHAPCEDRFIGKFSTFALRNQRNYRQTDRTVPWIKELEWLYNSADTIFPTHVFGHVTHKVTKPGGHKFKNKIFLDTGCVYGNELTAAIFNEGELVNFMSVKSTKPEQPEKMALDLGYPPKQPKPFDISDYDLDPKDLRLLKQIEENGIKYISGTMAPAPSIYGESVADIEPLQAAFDYYASKGVTQLVLQKKYMGSRAQLYLFKDAPEKTFLVTRNGWKIRGVDKKTAEEFEQFLAKLYGQFKYLFDGDATRVILDGELLPWRALGAGLIDGTFTNYEKLVQEELRALASDTGFAALKEFSEKVNLNQKIDDLNKFRTSLDNFTKDTPLEYKAFDVLDTDDFSQRTRLSDTMACFNEVNPDKSLYVDTTNEIMRKQGQAFFDEVTTKEGMEGVVVKPQKKDHDLPGVPPYMKVRSTEYLRIVYGYEYTSRLEKLCRQKNISGKVSTSIREHRQAMDLLTADGDKRKELIVRLIGDIKSEKSLDPRL